MDRYVELHKLPGWFYVDFDGCMFGMIHPRSGQPVKKPWRLLTNAPFLAGLGRLCDGSHSHTPLEGGYWTRWSAQYPWDLCMTYVRLVKLGKRWVRERRLRVSVLEKAEVDPDWADIRKEQAALCSYFDVYWPSRLDGHYPSWPLGLPTATLANAMMAPVTHGGGAGSDAAAPAGGSVIFIDDAEEEEGAGAGPARAEDSESRTEGLPRTPSEVPIRGESTLMPGVGRTLDQLGLTPAERIKYDLLLHGLARQGGPISRITHTKQDS